MTGTDPKGQDIVVTPDQQGRDQVRTGAGHPGDATVGHVFRGWKHSMRDNLILVLLAAILIGTLAGNHYSAKAAAQNTGSRTIAEIKQQQAQLVAIVDQTARALAILTNVTSKQSQANAAAATTQIIGQVIACVQFMIQHPAAALPPSCPVVPIK